MASITDGILDEDEDDVGEDNLNEDDIVNVELAMMEEDEATDIEVDDEAKDLSDIVEEDYDENLTDPLKLVCDEGSPSFMQVYDEWRVTCIKHKLCRKGPKPLSFS